MNKLKFVQTQPGADPIVVEGDFPAQPARVFQAFTEPELVIKWFGPRPNSLQSAVVDLRIGGAWQFVETHDDEKSVGFEGEYLEIVPGSRLVFTWSRVTRYASGERESTDDSRVEVTFSTKGRGTHLRVVHSAMQSEGVRQQFALGWEGGMESLANAISTFSQHSDQAPPAF